ncbi:hypothetical protein NPIL_284921 [Nephila pilipes]|uniref:Uncharacterized protein n=1 Tax=Nephila pilipes TaxID=299642 RepID=A0A8X6MZE4_NEPPI|nr:hypothetical protein NPIL_284921 [Nephila pilipes]
MEIGFGRVAAFKLGSTRTVGKTRLELEWIVFCKLSSEEGFRLAVKNACLCFLVLENFGEVFSDLNPIGSLEVVSSVSIGCPK